jgi:hypothetical protein
MASRRAVIRAGMSLLGTGVVACAGMAAARAQTAPAGGDTQKLAQSAVQYQTHPNNGQLCSICVNFIAPNQCKLVQGPISPVGWCVAYAPKA